MSAAARQIPRAVFVLGLASLFTDFSSEMIYPLLPAFLATVLGAGAVELGLIEGVAEATASLLKVVSGFWTDRVARRKPLIVAGYGFSGLFRPLIGLAWSWPVVLLLRFLDRIGKGLRTSPRDALIADVTPRNRRGAAYGLHRGMDHAGAVVGPLAASAILALNGQDLRQTFLLAFIPALITMLVLIFGVREPGRASSHQPAHATAAEAAPQPPIHGRFHPLRDWRRLGGDFQKLLLALFIFTLGNATDAFFLVRLAEVGVTTSGIAALWSVHNGVKMVSTYYGGKLSDRLGWRPTLVAGWAYFALIYLVFAAFESREALIGAFVLYGVYFGLVEPSERALVASLAPSELRGRAFGFFHLVVGLGALPASAVFGLMWKFHGAPAAFTLGAALASLGAGLMLLWRLPGATDRLRHQRS